MLPRVHLIETETARYAVFANEDVGIKLATEGVFDAQLLGLADFYMASAPGYNVLDIGANLGSFAIPVAQKLQGGVLYAFEAQRIIFQQLCANVFLNRLENVHAYHAALASPAQHGQMAQMPCVDAASLATSCSLSLDTDLNTRRGMFTEEQAAQMRYEDMPFRMIDEYPINNLCLVKIDVEGYEEKVLRGAEQTLRANRYPPIIFECWTDDWYAAQRETLMAYLRSLGYQIVSYSNYNHIAQHPEWPAQVQLAEA